MWQQLKMVIKFFCIICTGSVFGAAVCTSFTKSKITIHANILWQILLLSLLMASLTLIYYSSKELSKKSYLLRTFIHYLGVNAIMIIGGMKFGWIGPGEPVSAKLFVIMVTVIYLAITGGNYCYNERISRKLNDALSSYHQKKQNDHRG